MGADAAWGAAGSQATGGLWQIVGIVGPVIFGGLLLFFVLRAIVRQGRYRAV